MDPASAILGIASGTVMLAGLALKIGQTLRNMAVLYNRSAALLYSLIGACQAIEVAWNRINTWIASQPLSSYAAGSAFFDQLTDSIEAGKIVLGALQQDLQKFAHVEPGQNSVSLMWKSLRNEDVLRDYCTKLNLQVSSLQLLLTTASLPIPEAQNLLCNCLKPFFRKDEESAWTIVASGDRSSLQTSESLSSGLQDDNESLYSVRHFSFTNDLLTAPVYKRYTLTMLSRPKAVPNPQDGPSTGARSHLAKRAVQTVPPKPPPAQAPATLSSKALTIAPSDKDYPGGDQSDLLHLLDYAAGKAFSSSTVSDLDLLNAGQLGLLSGRYLPIRASLKREEITVEERQRLDLRLHDATRCGPVYEIAALLDSGADINATISDKCETPLFLATATHQDEVAALFLLQYKNANIHVRDGTGNTLLHAAIRTRKFHTIKTLLDLGLSVSESDNHGFSSFNLATEKFALSVLLSTLLRHAKSQSADDSDITELDPIALHTACMQSPIWVDHALVLLQYGWSPRKCYRTASGEDPKRMSPLYLAILKKETALVWEMLKLPKDVVRINTVHGPCRNLFVLAMGIFKECPATILLLLRAGIDYEDLWDDVKSFAARHEDQALLDWIDDEELDRIVLDHGSIISKESISPWALVPSIYDIEAEVRREKRRSLFKH